MTGRVFRGTLLAAALFTLAVLLREIGTLLSRIEGAGQAFGPSVFTGPAPRFWETEEIRAAGGYDGLWYQNAHIAGPLVSWHLTLDLLFAVLLAGTLYLLLTRVSGALPASAVPPARRGAMLAGLPAGYLVADVLETWCTFKFFGCGPAGGGCSFDARTGGDLVQALSGIKWLMLVTIVVAIVVMFSWRRTEGSWSWQRGQATRAYRRSTPSIVVGPPVGLAVVVGLFLLLAALPAGGPLDQMPDVLRALMDRTDEQGLGPALEAVFYLVLFMMCVIVAAVPGTHESSVAHQPRWWVVLAASAGVSVALVVFHLVAEGDIGSDALPVLAFPIVVGIAAAAAWVFGTLSPPMPPAPAAAPPEDLSQQHTPPPPPERYDLQLRARLVTALLVAGVVLGAAVGMIRAVAPLVLVDDRDGTLLIVAVVIGIGAPAVMAALVVRLLSKPPPWWDNLWVCRVRRGLVGLVVLVVGFRAVQLTVQPEDAAALGTPATLTVILAAFSLVIGLVGLLSRKVRWEELKNLRVGDRTPWMAMLVVAWMVAGGMNTQGGYHDVRTQAVTEDQHRKEASTDIRSLGLALDSWAAQWDTKEDLPKACLTRDGHAPLVLVSAPGGGAKAAYWTGIGMDQVFGTQGFCPGSLFAVAGVSGGAVGLTTRLAVSPGTPGARIPTTGENLAGPVVGTMTDDGPLAATIAAMMLRDVPQPFVAVRSAWRDRAAVLEDMWAQTAGDAFDATPKEADASDPHAGHGLKSVVELGTDWWLVPKPAADSGDTTEDESIDTDTNAAAAAEAGPVLLLVGSSVNDGCRAVVSNVSGLPVGAGSCLTDAETTNGAPAATGAIPAAVDVLSGLLPSVGVDGDAAGEDPSDLCAEDHGAQTIRATSAGLLAARFPYVTPSGALRNCPPQGAPSDDPQSTYVVDGGYLENTGLLTLLQAWDSVADDVTLCNDAAAASAPSEEPRKHRPGKAAATPPAESCPTRNGKPLVIEPFLVMLENHYRSEAETQPASRPRELFIPPGTLLGKRATTLGTNALEQLAAIVVSRSYGATVPMCNRFIRLAPQVQAAVQAPLGWVLASSTRESMDADLKAAMLKVLPEKSQEVPAPSLPLRTCS